MIREEIPLDITGPIDDVMDRLAKTRSEVLKMGGVNPELFIAYGTFSDENEVYLLFSRPETAKEEAKRKKRESRAEDAERKLYERLKKKYDNLLP